MQNFEIKANDPYTVTVTIEQDDPVVVGQDFDLGTDKANHDYSARFTIGELINAVITVKVEAHGLAETASIGGCHLRANCIELDARELITDHGLISEALKDLKETFDKIRSLPMLPELTVNN